MRITTISYAKLVNLGDYSNERLQATIEVTDDDDPQEAFSRLVTFVTGQLDGLAAERKAAAEAEHRRWYIADCQKRRAEYQAELDKLHGLAPEDMTDWQRQRARDLPTYIADVERNLANPDQVDTEPADLPF